MANKFYSQNPNNGYNFTTKQDITNFFKINTSNYYADLYSKYKLQLEPKNSNLSVPNVNLGYKIGGVDIKNYVSAPYTDYITNSTFTVDSKYKMMSIVLVGGGGSGGSGANVADPLRNGNWSDYGAIGGSGSVYISDFLIQSSSDNYSVTIGNGGQMVWQSSYNPSAGVNGNSGGSTIFTNTTKSWYITAGGGGGGGGAKISYGGSPSATISGSGGTTSSSGTANFTNNYTYTGLGDGTTKIGSYVRCRQLAENSGKYPTFPSDDYGNSGNGGSTQWMNGGGYNTRSESGQPGFCRIYFK
jgi:hypothetical protein